jgi:hypothetical protein
LKKWAKKDLSTIIENAEKRQLVRVISMLIWVSWGVYLFVIFTGFYFKDWKTLFAALAASIMLTLPFIMLRRGHLQASSLIIMLFELCTVTFLATAGQGIRDAALLAFPILFIFAGLVLNRAFFRLCVGLAMLAVGWLALGETYGWFVPRP